jgi:hypothetical protein
MIKPTMNEKLKPILYVVVGLIVLYICYQIFPFEIVILALACGFAFLFNK